MSRSRLWVNVVVVVVIALLAIAPTAAFAAPANWGSKGGYNHGYDMHKYNPPKHEAPKYHASKDWDGCWYKVRWGDSMGNIAWRHGTSSWYLTRLNGMKNPDKIYAGTWMRVPCKAKYGKGW